MQLWSALPPGESNQCSTASTTGFIFSCSLWVLGKERTYGKAASQTSCLNIKPSSLAGWWRHFGLKLLHPLCLDSVEPLIHTESSSHSHQVGYCVPLWQKGLAKKGLCYCVVAKVWLQFRPNAIIARSKFNAIYRQATRGFCMISGVLSWISWFPSSKAVNNGNWVPAAVFGDGLNVSELILQTCSLNIFSTVARKSDWTWQTFWAD